MNDFEFTAGEDQKPLLPEGIYDVEYIKSEKKKYYSGYKLYVSLKVVSFGEFCGERLFKAYNYYEPLPSGCDLYKDLGLLSGKRIRKKTKLSMNLFKGRILEVQVRTVTKDRKQSDLPVHQHYSVVDKIIRIAAGANKL